MSEINSLKLNKHENVSTNTNPFDVEKYLNENWDNIQKYSEIINTEIISIKETNGDQDKDIESNSKSIEEIKEESAEIKAENVRLRSDINSIALIGEVEGESIDLDDSSEARFLEFRIGGNQKQETRSGSNFLDFNVNQNDKVTVNDDGTITINGQGGFSLYIQKIVIKASTKYYLRWEVVSGTVDTSSSGGNVFMNPITREWIEPDVFYELSSNEDKDVSSFWINGGTVFSNAKIKMWMNTDKSDFEPYGVSPSPDYPSDVETVGSNVNSFDESTITQNIFIDSQGKQTSNDKWDFSDFINVRDSQTITFLAENDLTWTQIAIIQYDSSKNIVKWEQINNKKNITKTLENNVNYIRLGYRNDAHLDKIKIEKGTIVTHYSPYGMGSLETEVENSNIMPIINLGTSWEYTKKGIKNLKNGDGEWISRFNVKKGQIVKLGLELLSKPSKTTTFTVYINSVVENNSSFINFCNYNLNEKYERTLIADKDSRVEVRMFGNKDSEKFEFRLWAEIDKLTGYVQHQSQQLIMPVQQEMLEGDYIADVEHHAWGKVVLTGEESFTVYTDNNINIFFTENIINSINYSKIYATHFECTQNYSSLISQKGKIAIRNEHSLFFSSDISTIEEFKAMLKSKYEEGNPITIYYKLAEPIDLELTEEQKKVAKQIKQTLHTYKNVTHISSNDEVSPIFNVKYAKDPNLKNENLQKQIDEIKQLLSTTQTSAMLLDNFQNDIESEVI